MKGKRRRKKAKDIKDQSTLSIGAGAGAGFHQDWRELKKKEGSCSWL
jgi:hypothetical protein